MAKVLVTPRSVTKSGHTSLDSLRHAGLEVVFCTPGAQPSEEELVQLLPGCAGYLAGVERVSRRVLEGAKGLKVISRNGTGVDNVDLEAAAELGIEVCRAEGANARGVAELALGLVLSLARAIPYSDGAMKAGQWERRKGIELEGRTLGLVGCGTIGRLVAGMGLALGMKVIAYDVKPPTEFEYAGDFRLAPLDDVLCQADVVSLHCPAIEGGRPLIDAAALGKMKRGALLVNTARASLVERHALARAIDSGHIAGAAFDVFDEEPPANEPIIGSDRVIATPHIGGFTDESVSRAMDVAVENILAVLDKK